MGDPLVNMALKNLENRMDAVELRSKMLAGKTGEIAQILEVKQIEATQPLIDLAIEQKTSQLAQAVDEKTTALATVVEQKRVELADEVSHKIEVERGHSKKEIESLNIKSIRRARRVFYIIMTIFAMMVATAVMGFQVVPMNICLGFLGISFSILTILIINL